jgi:WD40 repeat protein
VRLLESASNLSDGFSKAYLTFKPHDNAIMDLDFSDDDRLLVTGSGDQTCRVIDMLTQEPLHTLSGHSSSIKRVHFQPQSRNSIVASSSRDGNVNIWDLRTRSDDRPAQQLCRSSHTCFEGKPMRTNMPAASLRDSIRAAHSDRDRFRKAAVQRSKSDFRRDEASVTSLLFMGAGREHLLATSSEADATVKLWDMRTTYDTRRARPLPLSTTRQPDSHERHRRFGLTSMTLSNDSARLYTLCRDHTIYVYSTSHLILGSAPELTRTSLRPRRAGGSEREGLGPMYGFRHPQLEASTFYVKLSLRQQKDDKTELLAAGSGKDCAVLFPTNERYLGCESGFKSTLNRGRPGLRRSTSGSDAALSLDNEIPIYQHGTALVRGHQKEVTAVAWTSEGQLVTVSDDFQARCWREGEGARELRTSGEGQGKRWMCGWADVEESYDDDE